VLLHNLCSDHIYIRSESHETNTARYRLAAAQAQRPGETTLIGRSGGYSWIVSRALQTLRQRRMQMHAGQWAWSQVLPDTLPGQRETGFHLRPSGTGGQGTNLYAQLSEATGNNKRALRHQPGASATQEAVLVTAHESIRLRYRHCLRSAINCQYGRTVIFGWRGKNHYQGGGQ
jgi:hypothetical protein